MKNKLGFSGILLVLFSSLLSAAYYIDFESTGGTSMNPIPTTYQPVPGLAISYINVGIYNGGGTWNTWQYAGAGNGPQVFVFDKPVAISSVSLCQYDPSATTITVAAYSDTAGNTLLGTQNVSIPARVGGSGGTGYVWQAFTGLAQYGTTIMRIEFNAAGGSNPNAQVDNIVIESIGTIQPSVITLTKPLSRAVYQRNSQNTAMVPIAGTYTGSPSRIEARAIVMSGYKGTAVDWQTIVASPAGGAFNMTMTVPAGGWYRIEVRAVTNGGPGAIVGVDRIGVGEVFVTAGQSNSANWGTPAMTPANDIVSAWTGSVWRHGYDPQPFIADGSSGGSPWSRLMDRLVNEFDVPVGFISCGVGGTAIARWIPTTNDLYPRLRNAIIAAGSNGMRAILWHQGESDSIASTTAATYANSLNSIIAQSRVDAGYNVSWGIAVVAFHPNARVEQQAPIRAGQKNVIDCDPLVFEGPDTDIWTGQTYRSDTIHFNALGLSLHAEGWKNAILKYVHPWDINQDRNVTLKDFAAFSAHWFYPSIPVTAYWKLDETAGIIAADSSGNNLHGMLKNGPVWTAGRFGNALSFDGVNDYVEISGYPGISGTQSRTCSAWIKTSGSAGNIVIMSWGDQIAGQQWLMGILSTGEVAVYSNGPMIKTTSKYTDNLWHHVAVVLTDDGSPNLNEIRIYVDGVQITTTSSDQPLDTVSADNMLIGAFSNAGQPLSYFKGLLDNICIYNTALSGQQIADMFQPNGDFDNNYTIDLADLLIFSSYWLDLYKPNEAYWKLDEATGSVGADSSGNSHDGMLINSPVWMSGKIDGALSFDGVDDYVRVAGYKGIAGGLSRTCSVWFKSDVSTINTSFMSWGSQAAGQLWLFGFLAAGEIAVYSNGPIIMTTAKYADNQWHHAVAVLSNDGTPNLNEIKLYVDGIPAAATASDQIINTIPSGDVLLGAFINAGLPASFFKGLLDDVRIYDVALTAGQVTGLYNQ